MIVIEMYSTSDTSQDLKKACCRAHCLISHLSECAKLQAVCVNPFRNGQKQEWPREILEEAYSVQDSLHVFSRISPNSFIETIGSSNNAPS